MDFSEQEAKNGLRISWNTWPASRLDATKVGVPLGAMYTPMKDIEGLLTLPYEVWSFACVMSRR